MWTVKQYCRACGYGTTNTPAGIKSTHTGERLVEVFDLGVQPLANDFKKLEDEHSGYAPLKVMFCPRCTLAQLSVVVKPEILYSNYPYTTSRSDMMLNHFGLLWRAVKSECHPESVIEIGSNDGCFLKFCKDNGASAALGIDPAENLRPGDDSGIITVCGLFTTDTAEIARSAIPRVDVIVARHVFAHVDDWDAFVRGLDALSNKDTIIVIECPYVTDLLEGSEFDTIYHEHLSYVSLKAVSHLLKGTAFHLHKVRKFGIHGGAVVFMLRRNDSGIEADGSVEDFFKREEITTETWKEFGAKSAQKMDALKSLVSQVVSEGKTVAGFGASAKSTVWINACGFTRKEISFICDNTPQKQLKFSPGSDIPIVDEGALLRELPDFTICFAWNFLPEIMQTQKLYLDKGGKFINPHAL